VTCSASRRTRPAPQNGCHISGSARPVSGVSSGTRDNSSAVPGCHARTPRSRAARPRRAGARPSACRRRRDRRRAHRRPRPAARPVDLRLDVVVERTGRRRREHPLAPGGIAAQEPVDESAHVDRPAAEHAPGRRDGLEQGRHDGLQRVRHADAGRLGVAVAEDERRALDRRGVWAEVARAEAREGGQPAVGDACLELAAGGGPVCHPRAAVRPRRGAASCPNPPRW
jgi:hypothetical protein